MASVLTTQNLTLRPVKANDLGTFHDLLTNQFIRKYLCDDEIFSREQSEDFVLTSEKNFAENNYGLWLIVLHSTKEIIGFTGLQHFFAETQPQLLYALLPEFTGKGFATEAAQAVIDHAFSKLKFSYLDASCDAPNIASQKVAEKLSMQKFKEESAATHSTIFYRLQNNLLC